jgi:Carboxypeptidase regulatory-like domain/TonB dependent receptor
MAKRVCAMIALIVAFAAPAAAQTAASGTVEGIVKDPTGGVLPGVTVIVRNMETNVARETVTDEGGRYRAAALQPGRYEVSAELAGFEGAKVADVIVQVGQNVPIDVQLRPAGVSETLTVSGESPVIDIARTDVSNVVGQQAITNLPINGRRWENFVLLSPGVTNDGNFGLVSYRGISGLYNNNTVDGVDNNQAFFSEARGRTRTSYTISQAAIREFQVGISNFSAEFGRAAGGTVNAVTKSGTNTLHGEGFYFLRDDAFQAREPFTPTKPDERRQQFGVSVGGPIRRDKVFFFANYDQQLRDFPGFVRPSNVTFFESSVCTAPGCAATRSYLEGLTGFFPREGNNRIFLGKVDTALNPKHNLAMQYNLHRWRSPNGIQTQPILIGVSNNANGTDIVETDFAVVSLNSVLSNKLLNEMRVQIGRDFEAQEPNAPGPSTTVTGGVNFGMPDFLPRPKYPDEKRFQVIDNISYYMGSHSLKAGIDFNFVREDVINLFNGGGVYSYTSLNSLAQDCPADATGCVPVADATTRRHYSNYIQAFDLRGAGFAGDVFFTTNDYNFFIQDTWTVGPQLTLNLGLRYEYQQLPQPGEAEVKGVVFSGNPSYPLTQSFNQDTNNWGPRFGFTHDMGGNHTTIVKGGYGIYFGRTSNSVLMSALTNNAVTFATYSFNNSAPGAPTYPNVLSAPPTSAGARPNIQYLSPDLERPAIHMADITFEREVAAALTVSASYLFSRGTHLPLFIDTNLPAPSAQVTYLLAGQNMGTFPFYRGTRPDSNIGAAIQVLDVVDTQYHGLVLQANRRFSKGLLFNVNYTLSKATDDGQNSTTFISNFPSVFDPGDLDSEEGLANFDRRHRFVGSFHYAPEYLWGIQVGGVLTLESGLPVTATIQGGVNAAATGAVVASTTNGTGGSFRVPFLERNSFRQDGRQTFDMRLSKSFDLAGRGQFVILWEAFNLFNRTNYTGYTTQRFSVASSSFNAATNTVTVNLNDVPGFLTPSAASNTIFGPRDMQLGLKFIW